MLCFWYFSLGRTEEAHKCLASTTVGNTNLNNKKETRFFCFIISVDGKVEGYIEPFMPHWKKQISDCTSSVDTFTDYTQSIKPDHHSQAPRIKSSAGPEDRQKPTGTREGQVLNWPFHPMDTLSEPQANLKCIRKEENLYWINWHKLSLST